MERNQETSELVRKAEVAPNKVTILDYATIGQPRKYAGFRTAAIVSAITLGSIVFYKIGEIVYDYLTPDISICFTR